MFMDAFTKVSSNQPRRQTHVRTGELAKKVRLIAPTLDKAKLTFATILHHIPACASYDSGNEKKRQALHVDT